ncbi:hypothetical protein CsSME_00007774 [Camellia sinensis var. sinensis]
MVTQSNEVSAQSISTESSQQTLMPMTKEIAANQKGSKHPVKQPIEKRPRDSPTLDLATPFSIQPKVKGSFIPIGASAVKEPRVALSMATVFTLPLDKVMFLALPDVVSIAVAAQSTILAVE